MCFRSLIIILREVGPVQCCVGGLRFSQCCHSGSHWKGCPVDWCVTLLPPVTPPAPLAVQRSWKHRSPAEKQAVKLKHIQLHYCNCAMEIENVIKVVYSF